MRDLPLQARTISFKNDIEQDLQRRQTDDDDQNAGEDDIQLRVAEKITDQSGQGQDARQRAQQQIAGARAHQALFFQPGDARRVLPKRYWIKANNPKNVMPMAARSRYGLSYCS